MLDGIKLHNENPGSEDNYSVVKITGQNEEERCFDELNQDNIYVIVNGEFKKLKDVTENELLLSFKTKIASELLEEKRFSVDIL